MSDSSREEVQQRVEVMCAALRDRGLKVTHQRMEVFKEVVGTEEHPDAETIFHRVRQRVPSVSLDTVYRTLCMLEGQDFLARVPMVAGPARFDANVAQHYHFLCTECGVVRDFRSDELDRFPVRQYARRLGKIDRFDVLIRGVCRQCAGGKKKSRSRRAK